MNLFDLYFHTLIFFNLIYDFVLSVELGWNNLVVG